MPYRPATTTEIATYLAQQKRYEQFKDAQKFAHDLIGEQATTVFIGVYEEQDEDGPFTKIRVVSTYDEEGKSLQANFQLPAWEVYQDHFPAHFATLPYRQQLATAHDYIDQRMIYQDYFEDVPDEDTTFDLRHPPEEPKPLYREE